MSDVVRWTVAPDTHEGFVARAREVWQYRRILVFFSLKSVQSLYSKTRLGVFWIFGRTLIPLLVGSFVFGSVMDVPSDGVPYLLFFMAGQIPWNCFDGPVIRGSRGLEVNRMLLTKLYVPRIILPLGSMAAGLIEPAIIVLVFLGTLVYYGVSEGIWYVRASPSLIASAASVAVVLVFAFSLTLWTSVLQARARDAKFALRFVIGFWMYFTPVIYPMSVVPPNIRWLMYLNPLSAPIDTFRWGVLPAAEHSWLWFGYSVAMTAAMFAGGVWFFARSESLTMDRI